MTDYNKIQVLGTDIDKLVEHPQLDFKREVSEKTGLLSNKRVARYHFCKIEVYDSGIVLFSGSIHKLWNSIKNIKAPNYNPNNYKGYNGNDFTYNDIISVRDHLQDLFECESEQMVFKNIEFGINATLLFDPQLFIKGLLYGYKGKSFEYRYNEHFAKAIYQRYCLKIYNKSNQYRMANNTLRVEVKVNKMEEIKDLGISTFADINSSTLNKALELLLRRFDEVVYYDNTIRIEDLNKSQKNNLKRYSNPRYWLNELKSNKRDKPKKKLKNLILNYSDNLHFQIRKEIERNGVIINHSSIGLNVTQKQHQKSKGICKVTGLDLIHEKKGSKYVKTSTLKYLLENDYNQFSILCSELFTRSKGIRPKYEVNVISHMAKQIRNRYYNSFKIKNTGYNQKKYLNQKEIIFTPGI